MSAQPVSDQSAETPSLLRNATFLLILIGSTISTVGDGFHSVALGIWVLKATGSAKAMSAVMATNIIVGILLGAVGGTVADRTDRRRLMWSMDLVRGALVFGIAWLIARPHTPFAAVLAMTTLVAVAGRFRGPAFSASLINIVGKEHLQRASSLMQMTGQGAMVIGPMLGGVVAGAFGGWAAMVGDASSFLISAAMILVAPTFASTRRPGSQRAPFWTELASGLRYITGNDLIRSLAVMAPMINFFSSMASVLLVVLVLNVWHATGAQYGTFQSMVPLGFALGAFLLFAAGKRVRWRGHWLLGSIVALGPLLVLVSLMPGTVPALPLMLVYGGALSAANVIWGVIMQTEVQRDVQGRVFGTMNSLTNIAGPVAVALGGVLGDLYGPAAVIFTAGCCLSAVALLSIYKFRGLWRYN